MNLISVKLFFCRKDVKVMIICTATGGILQILSRRFLKKHPEFLKKAPPSDDSISPSNDPISPSNDLIPRGGNLAAAYTIVQAILAFLAEHGLTAGAISGGGYLLTCIPKSAINTYLRCLLYTSPSPRDA